MLTLEEKNKIKDVLRTLNVNPAINFAYFLNAIDSTNNSVLELRSKIDRIEYNQKILNDKLDRIIRLISGN